MKRLLALVSGALSVLTVFAAFAGEVREAEYGVARSFDFTLLNADGTLDIDEVDGGTEITLDCNNTPTNPSTNDFTDEGSYYTISLTAAEMACARLTVTVAATLVEVFHIETCGHPDSRHPWKCIPGPAFGTAQSADGNTSDIQLPSAYAYADDALNGALLHIVAGAGAGDIRLITDYVGATDEATVNAAFSADPTTTTKFYVYPVNNANLLVSNGIVQSNIKQFDDDATAAVNAEALFDNTGFAMSNSTVGTVTTYTGNTPQTGDNYPRLGAPAGASHAADILVLDNFVDGLESTIGAAGAGLTGIPDLDEVKEALLLTVELTADSGTTSTLVDAALTEATNNWFAFGSAVVFTSGTLARQVRCITGFTASSDTLRWAPLLTTAVTTHTYYLIAAPGCAILGNP